MHVTPQPESDKTQLPATRVSYHHQEPKSPKEKDNSSARKVKSQDPQPPPPRRRLPEAMSAPPWKSAQPSSASGRRGFSRKGAVAFERSRHQPDSKDRKIGQLEEELTRKVTFSGELA